MSARISRKQAWCKLAALVADGAPAPLVIRFQGEEPDGTAIVAIQADSSADFDAWSALLGCRIPLPPQLATDGNRWIMTAHGDWNGWAVSLCAYPPVEPEPEPVAEDMSRVREVAEHGEDEPRCPDPECGEPLALIASGAVGHCGRSCAPIEAGAVSE